MMKSNSILIIMGLLAVFLLMPELAYADLSWESRPEDASVQYLGQIFGNVGTALIGVGSSVIGDLFRVFNIAVLSLGSIVVSYTIVLSTMNTAQEGEVMGRKWSSVWIPLRAAIGMGFLLPTLSGYSLIQVFMMKVVIYGIAAANQVYEVAVSEMAINGGGGVFAPAPGIIQGATPVSATVRSLAKSMACAETINTNPSCSEFQRQGIVSPVAYQMPTSAKLIVGIPQSSDYSKICGGLLSSAPNNGDDVGSWVALNAAGMSEAAAQFRSPVNLLVQKLSAGLSASDLAPDMESAANAAVLSITSALNSVTLQLNTSNDFVNDALKRGWLFTGSHYFDFVAKGATRGQRKFPQSVAEDLSGPMSSTCKAAISAAMITTGELVTGAAGDTVSNNLLTTNGTLQMQKASLGGSGGPLYDIIANAVKGVTVDIMNTLTKAKDSAGNTLEPISSMRQMGSDIMIACENIWFAIILASFLMMILGCSMSGMNPLCWALGAIITILVPVLTLIIGLLWGAGGAIGIYLPMIPYLVFTFTALGWMLLVIETIAAAPIVALGLVSPAQENLGKASAAVMLITGVFLRPSLMVIGFVIAVKLVTAAIAMVNFGFVATVDASTGHLGIFGCIALLCLYGGLCIGIVHECFSLVYILPDKITRWIGGQAESSGGMVEKQLGEAKGAIDKGHEIGGGLMKSSAGAMASLAKDGLSSGGQGQSQGQSQSGKDGKDGKDGQKGESGESGESGMDGGGISDIAGG